MHRPQLNPTPHKPTSTSSCRHQRLVDRVLTDSGTETGQVRCLECGAIIADQPSPQWQEVLTQRPFVQS
ncbi:MAG: hypothetical protein NBKEAIPA_03288 [Nitrospirae bacterium]|nr:hypothetical protein [Nitrospirota bacterium]MCK6492258.1 hypothetical protein [Nitrospira sp.]MEB2339101.1 hypothetical protein [Nitrospirales bacterium]MCK6499903.1 hypothetical protein [Nitrospira sp.]QOJ35960.1 MAG: hypothetical protein HRU82_13835 [Nitrospira sp.]